MLRIIGYALCILFACLLVFIVIGIVNSFLQFFSIRTSKSKQKSRIKRVLIQWSLLFFFVFFSEIAVCSALTETANEPEIETVYDPESAESDPQGLINAVDFEPETINDEYTLWDMLFLNELGFENYLNWNQSSFTDLRNKYHVNITDLNTISLPVLQDLRSHIQAFYGDTYYTRTITEIDAATPELNQRYQLPPQLYVEEFYLRSFIHTSNVLGVEQKRQIGRSASDALKQFSVNEHTNRQLLFFSAMSIAYNRLSLAQYDLEGCSSFSPTDAFRIEYRIAESYLYLIRYYNYGSDAEDHIKHLLLSAEAYLLRAEERYEDSNCQCEDCDINSHLRYFDSYMAYIKHRLYAQFNSDNTELLEEALYYAERYLNSSSAIEQEKKSCEDLIAKYGKP